MTACVNAVIVLYDVVNVRNLHLVGLIPLAVLVKDTVDADETPLDSRAIHIQIYRYRKRYRNQFRDAVTKAFSRSFGYELISMLRVINFRRVFCPPLSLDSLCMFFSFSERVSNQNKTKTIIEELSTE